MKNIVIVLMILTVCSGCNETSSSQSKSNKEVANIEPDNIVESQNTQDDWYWQNTQKSTNHKFENWEHGAVELFMDYRYKNNQSIPDKIKVGQIKADGTISIHLPETIQTETQLGNLKNLVFYDIQDISKFTYTIPEAGYFSKTTLNVEKNEQTIGTLTLGNSVRVTYNLTNQSTLSMGDEGYIISWAYLDRAARMQGTETTINKVRRDGTDTIEAENTVAYNLEYKPGWNLIKTEVIGKYNLDHERGLNTSWFKAHDHSIIEGLPSDAEYFFRTITN